jgi:glycosyltransferase involved in cell wall biosynthesis
MKFSVLINNYNYANFIGETLASVGAQSLAAHEIIVVDDGSTDDSLEVLTALQATLPNLKILSQANGGQLAAIRTAITAASGDWLFFMDADDLWKPDHLKIAAVPLQKHPSSSVYYSGHQETKGPPLFRSKWPAGPAGPFRALVSATGVRIGTITSTVALRSDIAAQVAELPLWVDHDWRIRADDVLLYLAAYAGAIFYHSKEASVLYRIHGSNAFAHQDEREKSYVENKERLFDFLRSHYHVEPANHLGLLSNELASYSTDSRSCEVLRRYRRAIRFSKAPYSTRLLAYLKSYRRPKTKR